MYQCDDFVLLEMLMQYGYRDQGYGACGVTTVIGCASKILKKACSTSPKIAKER